MQPSSTAIIYRLAYRRADRDPRRGYTYKLFKGERQLRSFVERLRVPPEEMPEKYRDLAPIAELYIDYASVQWVPLGDGVREPERENIAAHGEDDVFVGGEFISREAAEQWLEHMRTKHSEGTHDYAVEIAEYEEALS